MYLSENLKLLREKAGLRQSDLDKMLNLNRGVYSTYEAGTSPKYDTLIKICKFYRNVISNLSMQQLIEDDLSFIKIENISKDLENSFDSVNFRAKYDFDSNLVDPDFITLILSIKGMKELIAKELISQVVIKNGT